MTQGAGRIAEGALGFDRFQNALGIGDLLIPSRGVLTSGFQQNACKADGFGIRDAQVSAGEITNMNIVPLGNEPLHGAAHPQHVILGLGGEDEHRLGKGRSAFRP